uniref:Allatostatin-A2 n=1 Tax=Delia radicum TaxID=30064 RepID=ALLA2_DELRA|nr:RecName: Full=Allatostatin-A2; Short=AST-A2; AltName: Full=NRPYSFGL-amide [Delia radicum]
NRPYSFGL